MLTENYYKILAIKASGKYINCTNVNNSLCSVSTGSYTSTSLELYGLGVVTTMTKGIVLGDGVDAPTRDDYKLSGNIITTVSTLGSTYSYEAASDGYVCKRTLAVQNTGADPITVREIGWVGMPSYGSGACYVLLDRTLLDTPVTIPAGKSAQIEYIMRISYYE